MNDPGTSNDPTPSTEDQFPLPELRSVPVGLLVVALSLLVFAILFYVLTDLAGLLRPLLIAVFLCYLVLPAHRWLVTRRVPPALSFVIIIGAILVLVYAMGVMVYDNVGQLVAQLPDYERRVDRIFGAMKRFVEEHVPAAKDSDVFFMPKGDLFSASQFGDLLQTSAGTFVGFLTQTIIVTFYLVFLLMESSGFPRRVRRAFGDERAEQILGVTESINLAIYQYMSVKTKASVLLATPVAFSLWLFGADFWLMWGVLTFFANFVPYVGSFVVCALPILLGFLQFDSLWRAAALGVVLVTIHQVTGNLIEPRMTGEKLGISPLMILLSLAFWGSIWGIVGMVLAVPLVVITKIVLENIEPTKPLAVMVSND